MLEGVRLRGGDARILSFHITTTLEEEDSAAEFREQQMLAALSFWGPDRPLQALRFEGDVQLTLPVAAAAEAAAPANLGLAFKNASAFHGRLHSQTVYALQLMLPRLVPRLEGLGLLSVGHWPPVALQPLATCTALQRLDLCLDGGDAWFAPDLQEAIRLASGLPRLLILALNGGPAYHERTASVRLDRLSALTGLTRLAMSLPILAQSPYSLDEVRKWEARLWRTERQQLSQALRSMPALEELRAEGLCLDVRDLAALPQLRRLSLGGLLLPPTPGVRSGEEAALEGGRAWVQEQPEGAEAGAEAGPADVAPGPSAALRERWPLPPQLEVLDLEGASPSLLAALVLPQSLRELGVTFPGREGSRSWPTLHLNSLDLRQRPVPIYSALRPNYDVRPETAAQLGPVLDLLAERSRGPITALSVCADADVRRGQCIVPGGHCVWLEALSRLPLEELLLEGVRLDAEADVVALTQLFPQLTVLILGTSPVLVDSMAHLSALTRLRELTLCLDLPPPCEDPLEAIERAGEALLALVGAMPELRVLHGRDQSIVGTITYRVFYSARHQLSALRPELEVRMLED